VATVVLLVSGSILVPRRRSAGSLSVMLRRRSHASYMTYFSTISRVLLQSFDATRSQALAARSLLQFRRRFRCQCAGVERHILLVGGHNSVWRWHMGDGLARSWSFRRCDSGAGLWWCHVVAKLYDQCMYDEHSSLTAQC